MTEGQFGQADVPAKAIAAQEIIYIKSTAMSVVGKCGLGMKQTNEEIVKVYKVKGVSGEHDVSLSSRSSPKKILYNPIRKDIIWDEYEFEILDEAKMSSLSPKDMWTSSLKSAAEWFSAIKDYVVLSELVAKAGGSGAATTTWDNANANIESDVVEGVASLMTNSNFEDGTALNLVVPASVLPQLMKTTFIGNVQQSVRDYVKKAFTLNIVGYRPRREDGSYVNDGLTTNALLFPVGPDTATFYEFSPAALAAKGVPSIERVRNFKRGEAYVQKMGSACLVDWDGEGTYTTSTNYLNNRVYKITGVKS